MLLQQWSAAQLGVGDVTAPHRGAEGHSEWDRGRREGKEALWKWADHEFPIGQARAGSHPQAQASSLPGCPVPQASPSTVLRIQVRAHLSDAPFRAPPSNS